MANANRNFLGGGDNRAVSRWAGRAPGVRVVDSTMGLEPLPEDPLEVLISFVCTLDKKLPRRCAYIKILHKVLLPLTKACSIEQQKYRVRYTLTGLPTIR